MNLIFSFSIISTNFRTQYSLLSGKCLYDNASQIMLQLVAALHDPMTQQEYVVPLDSFTLKVKPEEWVEVDVLRGGKAILQEINEKMG